jgi:hypothetical protein
MAWKYEIALRLLSKQPEVARNDKAAAAFQRFVQQALGFSRPGGSE